MRPRLNLNKEIFGQAQAFASRHMPTVGQRTILDTAFKNLENQIRNTDFVPCIHLPFYVYRALLPRQKTPPLLLVSTTLLYMGIDLLDDIADNDLANCWKKHPASQIQLTAFTLLSGLPQLAITKLDTSAERQSSLQRILAEGLCRMAAGQHQDLISQNGHGLNPDEVEHTVLAKSGEELALFAGLAAELADASSTSKQSLMKLGRWLGATGQLFSDCHDIFVSPHSRDMANGTQTLPIALYLKRQKNGGRERFLELLKEAKESATAVRKVRDSLLKAGILRHCLFILEIYRERAMKSLNDTGLKGQGRRPLENIIEHLTFLKGGKRDEQRIR